ncbi:hypothetical protein [Flavobacterium sp.]|uniref:hypothetical protein n=1 Tax=Flavobacterium sp. TaxID=239 RepID=UPI0026391ED9|nr:hypothetical protein [Flavobacterium sp.]MDD3003705.1 hypothetical protein [Flavobacterium sp.]
MKKTILLLLISLLSFSCSVNDDAPQYYYEILPVESFEVPASFNFGQLYDITVYYKRPTTCHINPSLYFERKDSTRIIAIQSVVLKDNDCDNLIYIEPTKGTFKFEVKSMNSYVFKFYKGKDENNQNIYEEVIIPVNQ